MASRKKEKYGYLSIDVPAELITDIAKTLAQRGGIESIAAAAAAVAAVSKKNAPKRTHALENAIIVSTTPEKTGKTGKYVYQIYIDPSKNDIFEKYTSKQKRYYYPASQEYGYMSKRRRKIPGRYYMKTAAVMSAADVIATVEKIVTDTMEAASV